MAQSKKMSAEGVRELILAEGFRNKAYKDTRGFWTTGVGHLIILPQESELITKVLTDNEVKNLLIKDLKRFEIAVNETIKRPITQKQFDALVSIAFNIGAGAFRKATFARLINEGAPLDVIAASIMEWTKQKELIGRRTKEAKAFVQGAAPAAAAFFLLYWGAF